MAGLAIDNDFTSFTHTLESDNPWLSIEIPNPSTVQQVIIFNRLWPESAKLNPFQLWIGTAAGDYASATSSPCGVHNLTVPVSGSITYGPFPIPPFAFTCDGQTGNFVTLIAVEMAVETAVEIAV